MNQPHRDPLELVVTLKYASVEEFESGFAPCVGGECIFFRSKQVKPVGTLLRLELRLRDGFPAIIVQGPVLWAVGPDHIPPGRVSGMGIQAAAVDDVSARRLSNIMARPGSGELAVVPGAFTWETFKKRQPRALAVAMGQPSQRPPAVDALHRDLDDAFASILGGDDEPTHPLGAPPLTSGAQNALLDALRSTGENAPAQPPLRPPREPTNPFGMPITDGEDRHRFEALGGGSLGVAPSPPAEPEWRRIVATPELPKPPPPRPAPAGPVAGKPPALTRPSTPPPRLTPATPSAVLAQKPTPAPAPAPVVHRPPPPPPPPPPPEEPELLSDADAQMLDEPVLAEASRTLPPAPVASEVAASPPGAPDVVASPVAAEIEVSPPVSSEGVALPPVFQPPAPAAPAEPEMADFPAPAALAPPADPPTAAAPVAPAAPLEVAASEHSDLSDLMPPLAVAEPWSGVISLEPPPAPSAPPSDAAPVQPDEPIGVMDLDAPPQAAAQPQPTAEVQPPPPEVFAPPLPPLDAPPPEADVFARAPISADSLIPDMPEPAAPALESPQDAPALDAPAASAPALDQPASPAAAVALSPEDAPAFRERAAEELLPPPPASNPDAERTVSMAVPPWTDDVPAPGGALAAAEANWAAYVALQAESAVRVGWQFTLGMDIRNNMEPLLGLEEVVWPAGDRTRRRLPTVVLDEAGFVRMASGLQESPPALPKNLGPPPLRRSFLEEPTGDGDPWAAAPKAPVPALQDPPNTPPAAAPVDAPLAAAPPAEEDVFAAAPAPTQAQPPEEEARAPVEEDVFRSDGDGPSFHAAALPAPSFGQPITAPGRAVARADVEQEIPATFASEPLAPAVEPPEAAVAAAPAAAEQPAAPPTPVLNGPTGLESPAPPVLEEPTGDDAHTPPAALLHAEEPLAVHHAAEHTPATDQPPAAVGPAVPDGAPDVEAPVEANAPPPGPLPAADEDDLPPMTAAAPMLSDADAWGAAFPSGPPLPPAAPPETPAAPQAAPAQDHVGGTTPVGPPPAGMSDALGALQQGLSSMEGAVFKDEGISTLAGEIPHDADVQAHAFDAGGETTNVTEIPHEEEHTFADAAAAAAAATPAASDARPAPTGPTTMVQGVGIGLPGGRLRQVFGAGTTLPARWAKTVPGARGSGMLELEIHESPSERAADGHVLGKVNVKPPSKELGEEWSVEFHVDGDAVLRVRAHPAKDANHAEERLFALENTTPRGRARVARAAPKEPEGGGFFRRLMGR